MKRLIYCLAAAAILTACSGNKEYQTYVDSLVDQQAQIDTISSTASYSACLDRISRLAADFAAKEIRLNDTQQKELNTLSQQISEKLTSKYKALTAACSFNRNTESVSPENTPTEN